MELDMEKCNILQRKLWGHPGSYEGHFSLRVNFSVLFSTDFILRKPPPEPAVPHSF
jgi:hypothetical protein